MQTGPVNILIVDDVPERLVAMQAILDELGQNVVQAVSGREALRLLLQQDFAVILLDVNMPGMDGFETASLIRQRKRTEHVPIIFVTGFADETHVSHGYSLGAVDYILTPVVPEILRAKVSVFVDLYNKAEVIKVQASQQVELAREQVARAAAEAANRRAALLSEISRLLTHSLDYEDTLANVGRALVPALASRCELHLLPDGASPSRREVFCLDPSLPLLAEDEGGSDVRNLRAAREQAITSGHVVHTRQTSPRSNDQDEQESDSSAQAWSSASTVPLVARGKTLGTMTIYRSDFTQESLHADSELFENIAARSAIALDNARLYSEIREAERRKDEFLALLGHELRNPLAAVSGAVELLPMLQPGDTNFQDVCGLLQRQVGLMRRMVDDLLDVARITSGRVELRREILSVERAMAQAVELARPVIDARQHQLEVSSAEHPLHVEADPARLGQVLANLLINAAKYTEPGGRITFSVGAEDQSVVFRVRDSGIGLSPELLPHVFDLFVQGDRSIDRAEGGLGIGLTLVQGLAHMHGGRVTVSSPGEGQGSEFAVYLPAVHSIAVLPVVAEGATSKPAAAKRVLIVEDQDSVARMTRSLLTALGHEARIATNGHDALAIVGEYAPQVVLLDIGLPGMNGYEVARRLWALLGQATPLLIAITGYGQPDDRERSREAGIDHHLVKPLDINVLNGLLADAEHRDLRRRRAPSTVNA